MDNKILRKRTIAVIVVTVLMMTAEIYYGIMTNSMALTADGFHMGTHAVAFLVTLFVCIIALKYEDKTKKLNALGGYTSAIFLGLTSLGIIWESIDRFINPLSITFFEAITVAVLGLLVNIVCIFIMGGNSHLHFHSSNTCCECSHHDCHEHHESHENLNFKAAYLHILADAMTSVLAIIALLLAKYFGWVKLDSIIGITGGLIIAKWSFDLIKKSSGILLDFE